MLSLAITVNTKQRLRLRRLMYLLTAVLAIMLGPSPIVNLARAQARESGRISNSSCSRDNAINMIRGQIDAAKLIDKPVKRISVLMRAADLLWPYDQKRSRAAFAEAFDIAIVDFKEQGDNPKREGLALLVETPDQRYVVIRAVARRDQIWARKLTETLLDQEKQEGESSGTKNLEQDLRTEARLLDASASLLSSDIEAAFAFARLSLRYPAGFQLAGFLYRFAEIDRTAADQFYREAIAVYSDQPLSQLLYLSAYPFGNNRAAADMPVNAIYSVPADFIPNSSLQRLFLQTLVTRAQLALQGQSDRVGFNGISDDGQIWLALTRLAPQLKNLGSDIGRS